MRGRRMGPMQVSWISRFINPFLYYAKVFFSLQPLLLYQLLSKCCHIDYLHEKDEKNAYIISEMFA